MQRTGNLNLKKPDGTDVVDIADLNENMDILDIEVTKLASATVPGRMSAADKAKLDGIAAGANNYVHPTSDGNKHVPATGTTNNGKVLKAGSTAGSLAWGNVAFSEVTGKPTTLSGYGITDAAPGSHVGSGGSAHAAATTSAAGFMSAADKTKLNGIATGANNYVHPTGDGNQHIPATGTTNSGKVLKAGATAGSAAWGNVAFSEVTGKPTTLSGYGITDAAPSSHVGSGGSAHAAATTSAAGFMSAADKTKLDGLRTIDFGRAHGSVAFGNEQTAMTTAEFISLLTSLGAFDSRYWVARGQWTYAANRYINDTGVGDIHLAGCVVEVISQSSTAYTVRINTPTTSNRGVAYSEFVYVNNGPDYRPGWRKIWNDKNDGEDSGLDADLLDGQQGSYYLNASNLNAGTVPAARLPAATTSARGTVQLSTATNSTSTTLAATASAVKAAYDRAEQAFQSASNGKNVVAAAITGKGVPASGSETFAQLASKIGELTNVATGNSPIGSSSPYTLTVTGLSFRPKTIICQVLHATFLYYYIRLYDENLRGGQRYVFNVLGTNTNAGWFTITDSGFSCDWISTVEGQNANWIAFG